MIEPPVLLDRSKQKVELNDVLYYPDRPEYRYSVSDMPNSFARQGYCYGKLVHKRGMRQTPIIIQPPLMLHYEEPNDTA